MLETQTAGGQNNFSDGTADSSPAPKLNAEHIYNELKTYFSDDNLTGLGFDAEVKADQELKEDERRRRDDEEKATV